MNNYKNNFPIFKAHPLLTYLDNGATTQKPYIVIKSLTDFYKNTNAHVHRGIHDLSNQATDIFENARQTISTFIGSQNSSSIVFTKNTTESINIVAHGLHLYLKKHFSSQEIKKQVILISEMEHNSNLLPWQQLQTNLGIKLKFIPLHTESGQIDLIAFDKLITKYSSQICMLAVTHVSNVLGTINPIHYLTEKVHQVGGLVLIDAAQSVAHLPINVSDLKSDFLVFSGHKIYAPLGIGILYINPTSFAKLPPSFVGGGMVASVTTDTFNPHPPPFRYEAGTPNIAGANALATAINYLTTIGWKNIQTHEQLLLKHTLKRLKAIKEVTILGPKITTKRSGLISFTINNIHPHDVASFMNDQNIAIRTGQHCTHLLHQYYNITGSNRLSFAIYNTIADIDKAINVIKNIIKTFH